MVRTTVIALTGSIGKTTAKECLVGILSAQGKTHSTWSNQNDEAGVARTILGMRPWHRYAVIEIGTEGPGQIRKKAALVRPDVAIELVVAGTHTNAFPTLEDTAAEKGALLDYLRPDGIAILNGDDPRVRRMADRCKAKVVFFGQSDDCDVVAEEISSAWPERLRFRLRSHDEAIQVQTQLIGTHWLSSALAALAAARACEISLAKAVREIRKVEPFIARMQPIELPSGATVIRDDENGSPDAIDAMMKVLRESEAQRHVLVFSDMSDSKARPRERLRDLGKMAADCHVDLIVFVGEHGRHGVRGAVAGGMAPERCHHMPNLKSAAEFLKGDVRKGDLIFLEGRTTDHIARILLAQFGPIGCWKTDCRLRILCDRCRQLQASFDLRGVQTLPPRQPTSLASRD